MVKENHMNSAIDNLFAQQAQQQQQQQQYPADIANFNLIAATNKTSPRAPDFFGSTKINGTWFMLSAWLIFSRSGKQMINTAMRPATAQEAQRQEAQQAQYAANNPQNNAGGQFGSQQGHYQGQPQQPTTAFTGHAQQHSPQAQPQGAFGQPVQSPQAQATPAPWEAQGTTNAFTANQSAAIGTAHALPQTETNANPLEVDITETNVVHVDLPSKPSF